MIAKRFLSVIGDVSSGLTICDDVCTFTSTLTLSTVEFSPVFLASGFFSPRTTVFLVCAEIFCVFFFVIVEPFLTTATAEDVVVIVAEFTNEVDC